MRRTNALLRTAGLGASLSLIPAGPASAHTTTYEHGSDLGVVWSDHRTISVCDNERDGHRVYVKTWFWDDDQLWIDYYPDRGGADGQCETYYPDHAGLWWICEKTVSCRPEGGVEP